METPTPPRPPRAAAAGRRVAWAALVVLLAAMVARAPESPLRRWLWPETPRTHVLVPGVERVEVSTPGAPAIAISEPGAVAALVALYDTDREGWREAFGTPPGPAVSITFRGNGGTDVTIGLGRGFLREGDRVKTIAPMREAEWVRALDAAAPAHGPWL